MCVGGRRAPQRVATHGCAVWFRDWRLALFASDHAVCCTNDIMQTTAETSFEAARPVMTQRTSYISSNMPYDGEVRKRACALHVGVVASPEVPPGAQRLLWPTLIG